MTVSSLGVAFLTVIRLAQLAWSVSVKKALQRINVSVSQTLRALTVDDDAFQAWRKERCILAEVIKVARY